MPVTEPQKSCAQNWVQYKNSCYLFATNRFSWNGAKAHCEFLGSNLIEIYSSDENNFIKEYIRKKSASGIQAYWTGGSDIQKEDTFKWMNSGRIFTFSDWAPGEPNN